MSWAVRWLLQFSRVTKRATATFAGFGISVELPRPWATGRGKVQPPDLLRANLAFFHAGQPNAIHDYYGQAFCVAARSPTWVGNSGS